MSAIDIAAARLRPEEAYRQFPYDDATGLRVRAPKGNITWLYGLNLDTSGTRELADVVLDHLLRKLDPQLQAYAWYRGLDEPRQSVFLDLAFNDGLAGLLHFTKTIAAAGVQDWQGSHDALLDSDAARKLPGRYQPLAQIILTGAIA